MRLIVIKEAAGPKPLTSLSAVWKAALAKTRRKMPLKAHDSQAKMIPKGKGGKGGKADFHDISFRYSLDKLSVSLFGWVSQHVMAVATARSDPHLFVSRNPNALNHGCRVTARQGYRVTSCDQSPASTRSSTGKAFAPRPATQQRISPGTLGHFSREYPEPLAPGLPSPSE
jgi:hypothetical protein